MIAGLLIGDWLSDCRVTYMNEALKTSPSSDEESELVSNLPVSCEVLHSNEP